LKFSIDRCFKAVKDATSPSGEIAPGGQKEMSYSSGWLWIFSTALVNERARE
jgi:hypothetical protein